MKQWIFNASPLILLGKIDRLDLIPLLNPHFAVPQKVVDEIYCGPDEDRAVKWLKKIELRTHVLSGAPIAEEIRLWDLGNGESAVLQSCLHDPLNRLAVLDDLAARKCASVYQIDLLGTLGILLHAKKANHIEAVAPELEKLVAVGSNLSQRLIERALYLANE